MTVTYWHRPILNIFVLIVGAITAQSHACTSSVEFKAGFSATDGESIDFGNITLQRDALIGSVVAQKTTVNLALRGEFATCNGGFSGGKNRWGDTTLAETTYNGETLYKTGITGISLRIITPGAGASAGLYKTGPFPRDADTPCRSTGNPAWWTNYYCGNSWGPVRFELVKTAQITGSGTSIGGGMLKASVVNQSFVYSYTLKPFIIQTVACSVSTPTILVPMGKISKSAFHGVGSVTARRPFQIDLNCDPGTKIAVTLNGLAGSSDAIGVLALNPDEGKASGVGVQILQQNAPIRLGTAIPIGISHSMGTYTIPFSARYFQSKDTVTAGSANSTATFTMTYQ
ncbi:fimbrial protein [Serratia fonticola]|uniref:fimbrial protein n=1 Tax=Serratia fonticola TaxID=47917 RepID=UPI0021AD86FB|nr:fimbrial protein [Serratia fonticola]